MEVDTKPTMEVDTKPTIIQYTSPYPEWFIDKAREKHLTAIQQQMWLLTGLRVHPKHCALHLSLYQWHLKNSLVAVAAEELSRILKDYPDDQELVRYLTDLLTLVNSGNTSLEVEVLKSLSLAEQQGVYLTVATSQHDKLACTSTVLQMMRAYPSSIAQHAITTAKVLIKHEQQQGTKLGSVNPLRKMLILELMPLILSKGTEFLETLTETVVTLFVQLVAHYYIECANVTDPAVKEEYKIVDPWSDLKECLEKFAKLHNWQLLPDFRSSNLSVLQKQVNEVVESGSTDSGVFYTLLFLMFENSFKYTKAVDSFSLILVKHKETEPAPTTTAAASREEEPVRKRRRTLSIAESSSNIIACFTLADSCHRYLKGSLGAQFTAVSEELKCATWRWYSLFNADSALFNSDTQLNTTQQQHSTEYPIDELRVLTQQALCGSGPATTFKLLWSLLANLPSGADSTSSQPAPDITFSHPGTGAGFSFLVNTRTKLCLHVCTTLVNMVQGRISRTRQSDILALLLIIYQFDVGTFSSELQRTVDAIKAIKTFKYKGLLGHVTEVVLLEELLYLAVHTDIRLDIAGDTKKRLSKDEIVASIKGHVTHCKDSSEETVIRFIMDHKELIETKFSQFAFASG